MQLAFHSTKNHLYVLLKNCSLRSLVGYLPIIATMRFGELAYLFLGNKPHLFMSKMKAHLWLVRNLRFVWIQRLRVQRKIRRVPDKLIFSLMAKPNFWLLFRHYKELIRKN